MAVLSELGVYSTKLCEKVGSKHINLLPWMSKTVCSLGSWICLGISALGDMEMYPLDAGLSENVLGKLVCMRSCVKRNRNRLQTRQV